MFCLDYMGKKYFYIEDSKTMTIFFFKKKTLIHLSIVYVIIIIKFCVRGSILVKFRANKFDRFGSIQFS